MMINHINTDGYLLWIDSSNGDITKHDEIYRRNYLETLNLLSWWKIRDQAQEMMNKMNRNKYV